MLPAAVLHNHRMRKEETTGGVCDSPTIAGCREHDERMGFRSAFTPVYKKSMCFTKIIAHPDTFVDHVDFVAWLQFREFIFKREHVRLVSLN